MYSTGKFPIRAELIGYFNGLIYVAAFKDTTGLNHEEFYSKEVAYLNHPQNLLRRLKACYTEFIAQFKPSKKRACRLLQAAAFLEDPMSDLPAPSAAASTLAAAAAAAAAALAKGGL